MVCALGAHLFFDCALTQAQVAGTALSTDTASETIPHLKLMIGEASEIPLDAPATEVTVVEPGILGAQLIGSRRLRLEALDFGETLVIVSRVSHHLQMLYVEIVGQPVVTVAEAARMSARRFNSSQRQSTNIFDGDGTYTISFSTAFGRERSALNQRFFYRANLNPQVVLRLTGDIYSFFGPGDESASAFDQPSFGINRLSAELESRHGKLTLLDHDLQLSPESLFGFRMRGAHFEREDKTRWSGTEIFAGVSQTSLTTWSQRRSRVAGALLPIFSSSHGRLRAGLIWMGGGDRRFVAQQQPSTSAQSSNLVWHADGKYEPSSETSLNGALDFARGKMSWGVRARIRRGDFDFTGEATKIAANSPFIDIGAQSLRGRSNLAAALMWRPTARFSADVDYRRLKIGAPASAPLSESFSVGSNLNFADQQVQIGLRTGFQRQSICPEKAVRGETELGCYQTALHSYDLTLALSHQSWSSLSEARFWTNGATSAGQKLQNGFQFRTEVRKDWRAGLSTTAFGDYTRSDFTLAGLLLRNPELLPETLRERFLSDPDLFLRTHAETLGQVEPLRSIALPNSAGFNVGARMNWQTARGAFFFEARYVKSELSGTITSRMLLLTGTTFKLNAATSLGVNYNRSFGGDNFTGLTFSLTRSLGGTGGKTDFGKLASFLGLLQSRIEGRVFNDLDGNGRADRGEPGLAGVIVTLNGGKKRATTDAQGRYSFSLGGVGTHIVAIDVGPLTQKKLRATTPGSREVTINERDTGSADFGLTDHGFLAGRVFNDLGRGSAGLKHFSGIRAIRLILKSIESGGGLSKEAVTDEGGNYQFETLPPGRYSLELDIASVPENFKIPQKAAQTIEVLPLEGTYLDLPLSAQRAVTGTVYRDVDRNGQYSPSIDLPLGGALLKVFDAETGELLINTVAAKDGAYILRNLPAGTILIEFHHPAQQGAGRLTLKLDAEPVMLEQINLALEAR